MNEDLLSANLDLVGNWELCSSRRNRGFSTIESITYKIADCREERIKACRLVHDAYAKSGLMEPNPYQMRVLPYHLLATTDIFTATHEGNVICTVTVISDDTERLPMDSTYEQEINERRRAGIFMAEVSCLATHQDYFPRNRMFQVFVQLLGLVCQYGRLNHIDRLLLAIHPRHFRVYKRLLGVRQFGAEKEYASVRCNPAIACEHDFALMDVDRFPLYDQLYNYRFQRWELLRQPMLDADREFFRPAAELCAGCSPVVFAA